MRSRLLILMAMFAYTAAACAQLRFERTTLHQIYTHPDGIYSYAPSIVSLGDKSYIWTCHNHEPFIVRDDIVMTKWEGTRVSEERSVLTHSFVGWDSFHICDPSVMHSEIVFNKTMYHWAMFFLGNNVDHSAQNQIGVALSQTVEGPWEKLPQPVLTHLEDGGWGIGSRLPYRSTAKGDSSWSTPAQACTLRPLT